MQMFVLVSLRDSLAVSANLSLMFEIALNTSILRKTDLKVLISQ